MRCLVTGATGHLGVHLVHLLVRRNCTVAALVRPTSDLSRWGEDRLSVQTILGDLGTIDDAAPAIAEFAPDVVFHLGWHGVANARWDDPEQIDLNLQGSVKLLRVCLQSGCKTWIGLGSQAEYGRVDGTLHEALPVNPETLYATTKVCTQMLGQKLCEAGRARFVWLRLLATYGPWDDPKHLLPFVIGELLQGRKPALSPGEQRWDYLFVEDAAQALWRVADTPEAEGIFNFGSGQARSLREIVETARNLINPALPLGWGEFPYRPNQVMRLQADISRLKDAIEWAPSTSLEEGLKRTIEWQTKQLL